MNKKIKIIELLLKIAHGEYPKRFKYNNKIYEYKRTVNGTGYVTENDDWFNSDICIDDWDNLNEYVEILEDNTEEIEEIQEISDEYFNMLSDEAKVKWLKSYIKEDRNKINELVKVVKEIRKDLNK